MENGGNKTYREDCCGSGRERSVAISKKEAEHVATCIDIFQFTVAAEMERMQWPTAVVRFLKKVSFFLTNDFF